MAKKLNQLAVLDEEMIARHDTGSYALEDSATWNASLTVVIIWVAFSGYILIFTLLSHH